MKLRSLALRVVRGRKDAPPRPSQNGIRAAREAVAALAGGDETVVAGPWLAEVGYELLYWIPFLRWAVETEPSLRERLVVVSRGGVASWYSGIAARYVELFETLEPAELERIRASGEAGTGGVRKQMAETSADRQILERLEPSLGGRYRLLHPSVMFQAFRHWLKRPGLAESELPFRQARLAVSTLELDLPADFVAIRFYYRASFPETEVNRALVARMVARLRERGTVVSLDPRTRYDDHVDAVVDAEITRPSELGVPATNLAVQSAVVARASAFVGTYGGLAYLGPLLGVPSISLYSEPRFRRHHLDVARGLFAGPGYGRFLALATDDLALLDRVLPRPAEPGVHWPP